MTFFCLLVSLIEVELIYNILLVQVYIEVTQLYIICVYIYIILNFFITDYNRILNIIPCAICKVHVFLICFMYGSVHLLIPYS